MKTGLESLDTGAPEITYSGNQGPKSPQEDQRMMQEFEMQQMVGGENDRVRELLLKEETRGLSEDEKEELRQLIKTISAGMEGGIGDMAMKSGLIDEYRNYKMGQEEAGEQFMSPRDYYRSLEQDRTDAAGGGVMQLVKENEDGSRPGYRGDAAYGTTSKSEQAKSFSKATSNKNVSPGAENSRRGQDINLGDGKASGTNVTYDPQAALEDAIKKSQKSGSDVVEKSNSLLDLYKKYSPVANFAKMFGPLDNEEFFIKKVLKSRNPRGYTEDDFDEYMVDRASGNYDAYGNPIGDFSGGSDQRIDLPTQIAMAPITTDVDTDTPKTDTTDFVSNFAPVTSFPFADYRGGIEVPAADGGRIGYAGGGITDLRQGYFLGKLVKKAKKAVKKIIKSPIGKAALFAVGANYAPLLFGKGTALSQMKAAGGLGKFLMGAKGVGMDGGTPGLLKSLGLTKGGFGSLGGLTKRGIFGGITALSSLPLFMGQEEEEEGSMEGYRGPSIEDTFGMDLNQIAKGARAGTLDPNIFNFLQSAADGGRIGYAMGGGIGNLRASLSKEMFNLGEDEEDDVKKLAMGGSTGMPPVTMVSEGMDSMSFPDDESTGIAQATPTTTLPNQMPRPRPMMDPRMMQQMMMAQKGNSMMNRGMPMMGGRMMAQEGGMMDMGGMEKDYRNEGGFVPIGGQERADDVPARLSKNEFVFTADAVRNAGGGDIDKGAEIMENMMENLEAGGKVSKGSQGLSGAREMFATQQRLGEVL